MSRDEVYLLDILDAARLAMPDLPWRQMVGMRNIVIYEYDDVDLEVVWDAVTRDLPPLAGALAKRLPTHEP